MKKSFFLDCFNLGTPEISPTNKRVELYQGDLIPRLSTTLNTVSHKKKNK